MAKNIQIRNVPDEVHAVYKRRAAEAGMSLQEYLLSDLTQKAGTPTMQEWLDRVAQIDRTSSTVTIEDIVADIRRHRDA